MHALAALLVSCRLAGLTRPAAQQHLIAQVLHMAELRLRLQAFLQHFSGGSSSSGGRGCGSACNSGGERTNQTLGMASADQPVLQAFLSAVKEVLDMHDAAMQVLLHQRHQRQKLLLQQQQQQPVQPAMTLLQLVMQLRSVMEQLQQLAQCCWCSPCIAVDDGSYSMQGGSLSPTLTPYERSAGWHTTAQRLLQKMYSSSSCDGRSSSSRALRGVGGQGIRSEPAAAAAAAVAEKARAAALPWPGQAAAWADMWGWEPSQWQVQGGYMQGRTLVESLYEGGGQERQCCT